MPNPTASSQPALAFEQVALGYGEKPLLHDISLSVGPGQVVTLLGGSGSGKTTILRGATGQLAPMAGRVSIFGENLANVGANRLRQLRQRMGVLFQQGALFTDLTVFENVAFPLREHTKLGEAELTQRVLDRLEAVGLRTAAHLRTSEISGGMARRVALARAVVLNPELVLYDEPFAGLDPIAMGVAARLIRNLSDELGCASLLITHDVPESFQISDHVVLIGQGHCKAAGTPDELRASTDPYVRQFIDGAPDGPVAFHYPQSEAFDRWLAKRGGSNGGAP